MRNRILGLIIVGLLLVGITNVYAGGVETVKDNNDGNKGYILINTGVQQGGSDVGHWTDVTTIPELKGDKGDTGDKGEQGIQGVQGIQGLKGDKGDTGQAGLDGLNGFDGQNGLDGLDGIDGLNGKDVDPAEVIRLDDRIDVNTLDISTLNDNAVLYDINRNVVLENDLTVNGNTLINGGLDVKGVVDPDALILVPQTIAPSEEIGTIYYNNTDINSFMFKDGSGWRNYGQELNNHENRLNNQEGRIGDLEDTQTCIRGEVQFIRKENLTVGVYGKTDLSHPSINNEVGLNIVIGLGKSESQQKREQLEKRIESLERKLGYIGVEPKVEKTKTGWKISISEEDTLKVMNRF